jgi:hypothetical protein
MRLVAASLLAATALLATHAHAQECGVSPDFYERRFRVADIDAAPVREALDKGALADVARLARAKLDIKKIDRDVKRRQWRPEAFGEGDVRAALAIAVVRTKGAEGPRSSTKKPAQMKKNLAWAAEVLAVALENSGGDPVLGTWYGEAALATGKTEEARAVLEDLASADLIVSPEGWAALARLRSDDEASAKAARARCEAAASDASVCAPAAIDEVTRS